MVVNSKGQCLRHPYPTPEVQRTDWYVEDVPLGVSSVRAMDAESLPNASEGLLSLARTGFVAQSQPKAGTPNEQHSSRRQQQHQGPSRSEPQKKKSSQSQQSKRSSSHYFTDEAPRSPGADQVESVSFFVRFVGDEHD